MNNLTFPEIPKQFSTFEIRWRLLSLFTVHNKYIVLKNCQETCCMDNSPNRSTILKIYTRRYTTIKQWATQHFPWNQIKIFYSVVECRVPANATSEPRPLRVVCDASYPPCSDLWYHLESSLQTAAPNRVTAAHAPSYSRSIERRQRVCITMRKSTTV